MRRAWLLLVLALAACRPAPGRAAPEPAPPRTAAGTGAPASMPARPAPPPAPPPPPPPAEVERLLVPGDLPAALVRGAGDDAPLTVFLPGMCSNASAYLHTFPEAARAQGGVVAIDGDQACQPGFRTFSWDAARQHARIEAALAAAGRREIPVGGITIVGYSQGASLAEQMLQRWPERYRRVVLIGAPTDPAPRTLARAEGVVTMACARDGAAPRMRHAAAALTKRGEVPALYLEMPGCTHGNVADGEAIFARTFDFLRSGAEPSDGSQSAALAGRAP